jgi:hypothetical protein
MSGLLCASGSRRSKISGADRTLNRFLARADSCVHVSFAIGRPARQARWIAESDFFAADAMINKDFVCRFLNV